MSSICCHWSVSAPSCSTVEREGALVLVWPPVTTSPDPVLTMQALPRLPGRSGPGCQEGLAARVSSVSVELSPAPPTRCSQEPSSARP